ncbi:MAG: DNA-directed RNA polymerase subunit alpha, partial [Chloroflexi bacterium]|nr:DNA-directed RNA polymerase subunit alpha [Chloroflexota bacterium]
DAIFSPVVKVSNRVEPARIEQITNYDLLKMEIWTDGTISPTDALTQAAEILIQHLQPVAEFSVTAKAGAGRAEKPTIAPEYYDVPIEDLDLSMRAFNCLKRAGISTVGEVLERMERGVEEMLAIRNFGQKSLAELVESLQSKGYLPADFELS